jgi:hypothetical protein
MAIQVQERTRGNWKYEVEKKRKEKGEEGGDSEKATTRYVL